MKVGTVIIIFDKNWKEVYAPLLNQNFDHYELLVENQDVSTIDEISEYFKGREVILHAPFAQANLIVSSHHIRKASQRFPAEALTPLVDQLNPPVLPLMLVILVHFMITLF